MVCASIINQRNLYKNVDFDRFLYTSRQSHPGLPILLIGNKEKSDLKYAIVIILHYK